MYRNKNTEPILNCKCSGECGSDKSILYELVIRVLFEPWQSLLSDIEFISCHFADCVVLYKDGIIDIYSHLSLTITKFLNATIETNRYKLKLENIGSWSQCYETFLILITSEKEYIVLPKVNKTKPLFDRFNVQFSLKVVSVKLEELMQYRKTHTDLSLYDRETGKKNILTSGISKEKKRMVSTSNRQVSLKTIRKIVIPSKTNIGVKLVAMPLSGEIRMNENYPQQVSDEQNSDGRSIFVFSNGRSMPVASDNVSHPLNDTNLENNTISQTSASYAINSASHTGNGSSSNYAHRVRYPDYIEFPKRKASYARWIHRSPDPTTLSKAGFFYTNEEDLVRCFRCGIGLKDFSPEDNPLKEHVKHSGNCSYLVEILGEVRLSEWKRLLQEQDPELNRRMQWNGRQALTVGSHSYRHPQYQTRAKRLETFVNWPAQMMQRPEQLADAGLFYTGFEDQVRCFACDGGLRRWDPEDDPWTEHCRWFPACPFARETKGDDFIALVQASANLENEGEATQLPGQELSGAMEQMTIRDPEVTAALEEHKNACLNMGYQITEFNEAVQEIEKRGTIKPSIEEILDVIEVIQSKKLQESVTAARQNETPLEQNQRLKSYVICMKCDKNDVNALFLPCTHHRLCMKCAESVSSCPVCGKRIRQRIRTYMV